MPKHSQPGDLAIWYAASPDQEYRAYRWASGTPVKPSGELMKYHGPVVGVRRLTEPVPRHIVAAASGFNEKGKLAGLAACRLGPPARAAVLTPLLALRSQGRACRRPGKRLTR